MTIAVHTAMRDAIALAARAQGLTSPNPVVGCVVLDAAGERAGEGYHAFAGASHAEAAALEQAGDRARGGTVVVTLEPCDHHGRTGPCTQAILDAGVRRVVYAVTDPSERARGGARRLAEAGVEVESGVLAAEAERLNAEWLTYARLRRPHVTWKFAATLDGRSAAADGTSQWITGAAAREDVHRLRARCDAIIAGSGTVLADDPRLTVRGFEPHDHLITHRRPLRVIADARARTPLGSRVLDDAAPTLIAVSEETIGDTGEQDAAALAARTAVVRLPRAAGKGGVDLHALMAELAEREIVSVLLEGGPTLAGAFLADGLVDRVVAYLAPTLFGAGPAALRDAGVTTLAEAYHLDIEDITTIGPDLRITAAVREQASGARADALTAPSRREH
ncbi:bifunctional diaminohydroxyphosphoribosylaminopyrimidine deaminase/5-amino-6-(5-phosphoribosylamino)uracil reductase RibD [Actinoallomurus bryophytorum]|uniref:Riboflavin biosynthesis protein RibD n=1 Tax=Actinoallomurus bryophytorum TaxID=1490222 RepID=A0A543CC14_9ACTN|nr:bifunctional diaminohydroxyphosphoribosylaminopyrimidine deaminase/5-amino-6-(5-phosphoribosylamino)uracil reductase RibD [Actinoallomurus bryophytorum]TQL94628.1 diaminohydroxyphosphoribosylaminopyrimidine deaminase/5-amino-6-(5-phosphoribosylamino)uracil reductase [Actinoallomurus bryophytorum]